MRLYGIGMFCGQNACGCPIDIELLFEGPPSKGDVIRGLRKMAEKNKLEQKELNDIIYKVNYEEDPYWVFEVNVIDNKAQNERD